MRFKLDENVPLEVAALLSVQGSHDVDNDNVEIEGLTGSSDDDVFAAAQSESRIFVTQDLDFSDLRRFAPGTHAGIILIRLQEPSRRRILGRFHQLVGAQSLEDLAGCFTAVSDVKIRIRRPL